MSDKPYYYTQGKFWGGANASSMIYMILSIFPITGILGLDHLYLHSPGTFVMKFFVNILTLGFWYFYDTVQAISFERDNISKKGLSIPWFGPSGIGAGAFKEDGAPEAPQNNLTYMAYVLSAMFIPFGVDYLIAGDYFGAIIKFVTIFTFGISFIYGFINVYKIIMKPATVFCEGTYRYPPFSGLSTSHNPDVSFTTKVGCPETGSDANDGIGGGLSIIQFIKGVVSGLNNIPIIGPRIAKPIEAAITTVETTVEVAKQGVATAKQTVDTASKVVSGAVDVAVNKVPEAIKQANRIASSMTPQALVAQAMTNIQAEEKVSSAAATNAANASAVAANAANATKVMSGAVDLAVNKVPEAIERANKIASSMTPSALVAQTMTNIQAGDKVSSAAAKQLGGGDGGNIIGQSPIVIFSLGLIFIGSVYITLQKTFKRVTEYFADMPPMPPAPSAEEESRAKNTSTTSDVISELPPQPSESNVF
jgi:hypothetical protein